MTVCGGMYTYCVLDWEKLMRDVLVCMSVYVEKNQGGWCRGRHELAGIPHEKWKDEGDVELGARRGSGSFMRSTECSCSPG